MKIKYFLIGILTFVLGFYLTTGLVGLITPTDYSGARGPVVERVFNAAMLGIVLSNLLICSTLVVCTLAIINVLKNQK